MTARQTRPTELPSSGARVRPRHRALRSGCSVLSALSRSRASCGCKCVACPMSHLAHDTRRETAGTRTVRCNGHAPPTRATLRVRVWVLASMRGTSRTPSGSGERGLSAAVHTDTPRAIPRFRPGLAPLRPAPGGSAGVWPVWGLGRVPCCFERAYSCDSCHTLWPRFIFHATFSERIRRAQYN